jgi:hypothetical protein
MLVTGLASLTCQSQAWAIAGKDDFDTPDIAYLPISPEHELEPPQEEPPSVATQFQMEQVENKRLKALKTALQAKNKKLKAKLAALQAPQSALAPEPEPGLKSSDKKTKKKARKAVRLKKKKRSHGPYSHKSDDLSLRSVLKS